VLVAEPSIEQRLVGLGADMATRIHTLSVLPLRRSQLSDYIAHRLRAAGIHSRSPLGDPELRRIYRETGGVPGRINEAARTILEEIYETDHEDSGYGQMSGNPATTALLISGALLVITGGAWLWTQMDARDSPRPELAANARTETEASPSGPAAANRRDAPPLPAEAAPAPTPDRGVTAREQAGPQTGDDAAGRAPSAPAGPSTPIKATASASTVATDPGQQAEQPPARTPSPPEPPSGLRGPDWLMAQPEESYTLQVVAVREFAAVERLCEDPQACAGAAWFSEQRDETTWYRVVVGAYPTRAEALAAAEELPRSLRDQKPWVRSLRDVQRAIAAGSLSPKTGN
jgi:DamX protein